MWLQAHIGVDLTLEALVLQYQLGNTNVEQFQLQLSGGGFANFVVNPNNLIVNADTNASFTGSGEFNSVVLNWGATGPLQLSNANDVRSAL